MKNQNAQQPLQSEREKKAPGENIQFLEDASLGLDPIFLIYYTQEPLKNFRYFHLLRILEEKDKSPFPLDLFLANYFRANKALGSKDRGEIAEKLFEMIRKQGYLPEGSWKKKLDFFLETPHLFEATKSAPAPFVKKVFDEYGKEEGSKILEALEGRAPTSVRVNPAKISRDELLARWEGLYEVVPSTISPLGIRFLQKVHFFSMEEFTSGFFEVQDESSQLAALMIDPKPTDLILDYCSGSGGKSLALAHRLKGRGQLFLHDIRKRALLEAKKRFARAGVQNVQFKASDDPTLALLTAKMNFILVDAPCTGSGTWRRNPDQKWKFSETMVEELVAKQRMIFEKALTYLAPRGKILYSTCSLLREENEAQVELFCEKFHLRLCAPLFKNKVSPEGPDGFFAALLERA